MLLLQTFWSCVFACEHLKPLYRELENCMDRGILPGNKDILPIESAHGKLVGRQGLSLLPLCLGAEPAPLPESWEVPGVLGLLFWISSHRALSLLIVPVPSTQDALECWLLDLVRSFERMILIGNTFICCHSKTSCAFQLHSNVLGGVVRSGRAKRL